MSNSLDRSSDRSRRVPELAEEGASLPAAPPPAPWVEASQPDIAARPAPAISPALNAAIERVFTPPAGEPDHHTKAVVVLRDGQLIAERYAAGITPQTPLHGFSMTKSVTNALLGILVLGEQVSAAVGVGLAAIIVGVAAINWRSGKRC